MICVKAAALLPAFNFRMVGQHSPGHQASDGIRRAPLHAYRAWDAPTRWFHWINAILVGALIVLGIALLTGSSFGVGAEGRHQLQRIHAVLGGALAVNLLWRAVWAFRGGRSAQWRSLLPGGPGYWKELRAYLTAFEAGHPRYYIGHNPLARLGVTVLLVLLLAQILSGLALLGVDQLAPPADRWLAETGAPSPTGTMIPGVPWAIDWTRQQAEALRGPLSLVHLYGFYLLVIAVIQHVFAVVLTELREGGDLVSAMLTGWKSLPAHAEDEEQREAGRRGKRKQGRR